MSRLHLEKNHDIEALRTIAILLTLVTHFPNLVPNLRHADYLWFGGGVDLFFSVSGFLIGTSLLISRAGTLDLRDYAIPFWVRRIFRLWPAAIFWASAVVLTALVAKRAVLGSPRDLIFDWSASLFDVQNLHQAICLMRRACNFDALLPYWSLSLEEQFYFILPIALFFVPNRKILVGLLLFIAVGQLFIPREFGNPLWFIRSEGLIYGVVIAIAWHEMPNKIEALELWDKRRFVCALIASFLVLLMLVCHITKYFTGVIAICAAGIVFLISSNRNYLTSWGWACTTADFIGSRSYSIYLVHMPVFWIVRDVMARQQSAWIWDCAERGNGNYNDLRAR